MQSNQGTEHRQNGSSGAATSVWLLIKPQMILPAQDQQEALSNCRAQLQAAEQQIADIDLQLGTSQASPGTDLAEQHLPAFLPRLERPCRWLISWRPWHSAMCCKPVAVSWHQTRCMCYRCTSLDHINHCWLARLILKQCLVVWPC